MRARYVVVMAIVVSGALVVPARAATTCGMEADDAPTPPRLVIPEDLFVAALLAERQQKPPAKPPAKPERPPDDIDAMADLFLKKLDDHAKKKKVSPKQQTKSDAGCTSVNGFALAVDVPLMQMGGGGVTADGAFGPFVRRGTGASPVLAIGGSMDFSDLGAFSTLGFFGGPILYFPMRQRFMPFVEGQVGVERCCGGPGSTMDFGIQFGGGVDIDLNRTFMLRVDAGVRRVFFEGGSAGSFVIRAGLSIPFGQ